nr:uncharacterized protein CI109_000612 [Kwoniella shandongensis]KAA5531040.1 hypothetical protein CI109_000612 [Kwoniella shandongensis]
MSNTNTNTNTNTTTTASVCSLPSHSTQTVDTHGAPVDTEKSVAESSASNVPKTQSEDPTHLREVAKADLHALTSMVNRWARGDEPYPADAGKQIRHQFEAMKKAQTDSFDSLNDGLHSNSEDIMRGRRMSFGRRMSYESDFEPDKRSLEDFESQKEAVLKHVDMLHIVQPKLIQASLDKLPPFFWERRKDTWFGQKFGNEETEGEEEDLQNPREQITKLLQSEAGLLRCVEKAGKNN